MARLKVEHVVCDFCGYDSSLGRRRDFTHYEVGDVGDVDLCKWCVGSSRGARWTETRGHRASLTEDGRDWTCTCGATLASVFGPFLTTLDPTRFSMMDIVHRLAQLHTEGWSCSREGYLTWDSAS